MIPLLRIYFSGTIPGWMFILVTKLNLMINPDLVIWQDTSFVPAFFRIGLLCFLYWISIILKVVTAKSDCDLMKYDYLIVGTGFSGAVLAERLANVAKKRVLVVDKREHIGGLKDTIHYFKNLLDL